MGNDEVHFVAMQFLLKIEGQNTIWKLLKKNQFQLDDTLRSAYMVESKSCITGIARFQHSNRDKSIERGVHVDIVVFQCDPGGVFQFLHQPHDVHRTTAGFKEIGRRFDPRVQYGRPNVLHRKGNNIMNSIWFKMEWNKRVYSWGQNTWYLQAAPLVKD